MSGIEINLATGVLRAAAMFVSARRGSSDSNPNAAVHFRHADDVSLRLAATNGKDILLCRLLTGSERMANFYWPPDEQAGGDGGRGTGLLSMLITPQLMAMLAKAGPRVLLTSGYSCVTVRSAGEGGTESHEVQRLSGRQISLFDDIDNLPVGSRKAHKAGQTCVHPQVLYRMHKAAKLAGVGASDNLTLARLEGGKVYGIAFGSDTDLWFFTRPLVITPPAGAGLPPEWAMSGKGEGLDLDSIAAAVEEAAAAEEEQPALALEGEEKEESNHRDTEAQEEGEEDIEVPDVEDVPAPALRVIPDGEGVKVINGDDEPLYITLESLAGADNLPTMLGQMTPGNLEELAGLAERAELVFLGEQIRLEQHRQGG